ncbi:MAG: hypothetical protein WBB74_07185, partial [Gaiellaceae bacterium]
APHDVGVAAGRAVSRSPTAGRVALLAAAAATVWLPALWSGFVADDFLDRTVANRWQSVGYAFHHDTSPLGGNAHFYRPLWMGWNAALHDAFGGHAAAYHAVNLGLFALATVEVWLLVRRLGFDRPAWIAAAAFALYPRHGESVAWITGSTDLTATVLALGAVLAVVSSRRPWARAPVAAALAAGAALTKEVAFVASALALLLAWWAQAPERRRRLVAAGAIVAAQVGVLAVRTAILHGIGGYTEYPWRARRLVFVFVSYMLGSVSPPQLELTRYPVLLTFPLLALAFVAWRTRTMVRRRDPRLRLLALGAAWFLIGLAPAINIAIDLNNASGDRLLFLPSVGLAIALGAMLDLEPTRVLAFAAAGAAALSFWAAYDWVGAGRIAGRVVDGTLAIGPRNGELVLLTEPETYRTALVFPHAIFLDAAVQLRGRGDLTTSFCVQMQVRDDRGGQVHVMRAGDGFRLHAGGGAPFDVPVLRKAAPLNADCPYEAHSPRSHPGVTQTAIARPAPARQPAALAYFDGHELKLVP